MSDFGKDIDTPGKDIVYRQDVIDALFEMYCKSDEEGYVWIIRGDACKRIDALPSAQLERKKEKWINYKDEHCCSICDQVIIEDCWDEENRYDYCPYCGADMRGEE